MPTRKYDEIHILPKILQPKTGATRRNSALRHEKTQEDGMKRIKQQTFSDKTLWTEKTRNDSLQQRH